MRKGLRLVAVAVVLLSLAACGDDDVRTGPGFVGIDDSDDVDFAPLLTVTFIDPVTSADNTALILSDPASDGDIAFDPRRGGFTITTNASPLFFGVDSFDPNLSEFRAFLTFPLDGLTGGDVVPPVVPILDATVDLFITEVSFAAVVPTIVDLVEYGVLTAGDFDGAFLDFGLADLFASDAGHFVRIDVTPLMQTAQDLVLADFQLRFSLDQGVSAGLSARPQAALKKLDRTASPTSFAGKRPARAPRADGSSTAPGTERPPRGR